MLKLTQGGTVSKNNGDHTKINFKFETRNVIQKILGSKNNPSFNCPIKVKTP
uniref:Uncharacterized protein n=1 Tax=Rhizophagus irregularis (strain DAOM 181602 / DAOM 197198 / MUCL 43194) TaxID=747089 RepID=U9TMA8_RHIID